jgi:hypothetical protein
MGRLKAGTSQKKKKKKEREQSRLKALYLSVILLAFLAMESRACSFDHVVYGSTCNAHNFAPSVQARHVDALAQMGIAGKPICNSSQQLLDRMLTSVGPSSKAWQSMLKAEGCGHMRCSKDGRASRKRFLPVSLVGGDRMMEDGRVAPHPESKFLVLECTGCFSSFFNSYAADVASNVERNVVLAAAKDAASKADREARDAARRVSEAAEAVAAGLAAEAEKKLFFNFFFFLFFSHHACPLFLEKKNTSPTLSCLEAAGKKKQKKKVDIEREKCDLQPGENRRS